MSTSFIPKDNPDITVTISPNTETWCAKEVTFVPETPSICFTSGRGMHVCLSCFEEIHGPLSSSVQDEIFQQTINANIQYYAEQLMYWKGQQVK